MQATEQHVRLSSVSMHKGISDQHLSELVSAQSFVQRVLVKLLLMDKQLHPYEIYISPKFNLKKQTRTLHNIEGSENIPDDLKKIFEHLDDQRSVLEVQQHRSEPYFSEYFQNSNHFPVAAAIHNSYLFESHYGLPENFLTRN